MVVHPLDKLHQELELLAREGLLRSRSRANPAGLIDVASNDYLRYASLGVSRETNVEAGAGASRLVTGSKRIHADLESALADWVGLPDGLLFSSGYAANVGTLQAVALPGHVIVSDRLNHASIVDGCRLSKARTIIAPHGDAAALENILASLARGEQAWVVTESYFSMDGDGPDLRRLRAICDSHGAALYVDEAHALGVFGLHGAGLCAASGVKPDVLVGTLGKAVGVQGAFVAGSPVLVNYLWNRARSFVFSTGFSPILAQIALDYVQRVRDDDARRARLHRVCRRFRELVPRLRGSFEGPIVPVVLGTPERARRAVELLAKRGFLAVAIRPPTVPPGSSRLRLTLSADLSDEDLTRLAGAVNECLGL